eukprot:6949014-Pyramimonas_sp.AAC.1
MVDSAVIPRGDRARKDPHVAEARDCLTNHVHQMRPRCEGADQIARAHMESIAMMHECAREMLDSTKRKMFDNQWRA